MDRESIAHAFELPLFEGRSKVATLEQAVRDHVRRDSLLHVAYSDARPNAALMQIAREFGEDGARLRLVTSGLVTVQHALIELNLVESIATSFAGENYPMARPNKAFQRAVSEGRVRVENWSLWTLVARLMAGALGLPFMPVRSLADSDMGRALLGTHYGFVPDPFGTPEPVGVVAALRPDIVLLQGIAADPAGNVVMAAPYGEAMWGALAARDGVIACVERIASTDEIRSHNVLVRVPAHKVLAVCEVPFGSHPYGIFNPGFPEVDPYVPDSDFIGEVRTASATAETFRDWIDEWVLGTHNHTDYLEKLGGRRLSTLVSGARPHAWSEDLAVDPEIQRMTYSESELLVVLASRMVAKRVREQRHQAVLAGVGLANLAAWSAVRALKSQGAEVELMAEIGMFGYDPRPGEPFIFANRNLHGAKWLSDVSIVLGSLVGGVGAKALGVIGAAEIDADFRTNSTYSTDGTFLVGSGGANDILSSTDDAVVVVSLHPDRLVREVSFVTCPGDRVSAVVTSAGVFERVGQRIVLTHLAPLPGESDADVVDRIRRACPWDFDVADKPTRELPPSLEELTSLRLFDPDRTFLRGSAVASVESGA